MAVTKALLVQSLASRPKSDDGEAALNFLKQPDLTRILPPAEESDCLPAEHWLRLYKIRQEHTTATGIVTSGLPSLLAALHELQPSTPLAITMFSIKEWYGTFWSDQADRLIGFVLVERRSPLQEQERLDWLKRNLT
ncbi:hypothetical protein JQ607_29475 [Bradyrhizobium liaoningense]|uniref:hypothetical protein n=1 Tax=Bradyrhizobium liaoningense TaxID=43992 RepID=UPI001BAB06F9|nr:hypothetical protein [Bradyrhizobium liaoningense]MBR0844352.1 hypothetical protein [Bradyrhizobium liaoningense]MBR0857237.1 hypothetical protein [Bradyrhizobium liaoningense]